MRKTYRRAIAEGLHALGWVFGGAGVLLVIQGQLLPAIAVIAAGVVVDVIGHAVAPAVEVLPVGARIVRAADLAEGMSVAAVHQLRDKDTTQLEGRGGGWPVVISASVERNERDEPYVDLRMAGARGPWDHIWLDPADPVTVLPAEIPAAVR